MFKKYFSSIGFINVGVYILLIVSYTQRYQIYLNEIAVCEANNGYWCGGLFGFSFLKGLLSDTPLIINIPIVILLAYITGYFVQKIWQVSVSNNFIHYVIAIIITLPVNLLWTYILWPDLLP